MLFPSHFAILFQNESITDAVRIKENTKSHGVHPSLAGHAVIAQAWLKAVQAWA